MKFALVFLIGCFAIAAQASSVGHFKDDLKLPISYEIDFYAKDGLVEKLRELIEKITQKVQGAIDDIVAKAEDIVKRISEKVQEIISESEEVIQRIVEKVLEKIEEIAKQNEIAQKCVDENRPALQAAVLEANQQLQVCGKNAIEESQNIMNDIQVHIDAVHANIDILKGLVNGCIENNTNPIEVAKCVAGEAKEIRDNILELIDNAKQGLEASSERAVEIAKEANNCVNTAVQELEQKVNVVAENIEKCLDENLNQQTLRLH